MKTIPRATRAVSGTVVATETLKELCMKISRALTFLFSAALLLSSAAIAGEANKGTLRLSENVVIQGKALNPGKYTVEWDGSGPTVQVTLLSGKEKVATFPAHLTEQASPNVARCLRHSHRAEWLSITDGDLPGREACSTASRPEPGEQVIRRETIKLKSGWAHSFPVEPGKGWVLFSQSPSVTRHTCIDVSCSLA